MTRRSLFVIKILADQDIGWCPSGNVPVVRTTYYFQSVCVVCNDSDLHACFNGK